MGWGFEAVRNTFCPIATPAARKAGSRVKMLNVNLLTVNCSMFGRLCDSFLSHFPAYAATLFVCLAVASETTQMVHGSLFRVHGCFFR